MTQNPMQQEYLLNELCNFFADEVIKTVLTNLKLKTLIEKNDNTISFKLYNNNGIVYSYVYGAEKDTPVNDRFIICCSFYRREISSIITSLVNYQVIQKLI